MPIAVTTEQLAFAESVGHWAERAGTIAAVRAREGLETRSEDAAASDWLAERWPELAGLGLFAVAVPAAMGGAGGTVTDLAAAVEELAAALVPGPVLPTLLAALALASQHQAAGGSAAIKLLGAIAGGTASVGVATCASGLTARRGPEGAMRVSGTQSMVLGAGDASYLLLGTAVEPAESDESDESAESAETWFVIEADSPGLAFVQRTPVDFSRSLADVTVTDLMVRSDQQLSGLRAGLIEDLAAVLAVAEAAGVATWCAQTAATYARTRHQFGRPIGSFQAIKHLCAAMLCRAELATAAAADAASAADQAPGELTLAAAAAAALALDAAVDNAKDAVQVLGGIGFTWDHDAHLYLRRALSLRQLLGGSPRWRARTAELALGGARRHRGDRDAAVAEKATGENGAAGAIQIRKAARLVANAVSAVRPERRRSALAEVGYAAPGWPPPYGLSAGPAAHQVIDEELAKAGLTRPDLGIGGWAIPAIAGHGSATQLDRFAGPTLRGDITWCQLFSEPEAGSDLASLRTKAVRVDGGWLLTGQKVWTSLANEADWAICLARSDQSVPKHRGITFFLVSMRAKGIEVRPLREMTGRAMFNEVFLDEVFVPDDCVVGEPGEGWRVARTTLATERVAMVRGAGVSEDLEALLAAAAAPGAAADPAIIDQVGARLAEGLALSMMDERLADAVAGGSAPGFASAVRKLLGVAHRQSVAETALSACGIQGAAADGPAAQAVHDFLLTRCLSIAGGTSQILLSLVAERVLGLPRDGAS